MNRVAIVVLNWNGIEDTIACLDSLLAQSYKNASIVVIDNGSKDSSVEVLEKYTQDHQNKVTLLRNEVNKGFAGGVNTGITWAIDNNFDHIALFNNDAVADRHWLESLVTTLESSDELGAATGLLLHEDGKTIDTTGDWYSKWGMPFPRSRSDKRNDTPNDSLVFGASGGATLYKTTLFKDIGLFDEDFFAYYEDVDVSFRAQLAGYKVAYTNAAIAYHKQGASSKKIPGFTVVQTFKNLPLLFWKNVPQELLFSIGTRFFLIYTLLYLNSIRRGNGWPATKGLFKSIVLLPAALRQRHTIQKSKRVASTYIKSILWDDLPPGKTGLHKLINIFSRK